MYGVHTGERGRGAPSPRSHLTGKAYLEETGRTRYRDRWHLGKGRERRGQGGNPRQKKHPPPRWGRRGHPRRHTTNPRLKNKALHAPTAAFFLWVGLLFPC